MTNEAVEAVIQGYLDHLEEDAPEPTLDHLSDNDRALVLELIASLKAGRGINPYQSRPSFASLASGTEYEDLVAPSTNAGLTIDSIRSDVVGALGVGAEPIADGAALSEGVRSDAVVLYKGTRLRLQFRDDVRSAAELVQIDPRAAAGPIYGRFRDTAGVIMVMGDSELSSVPIGPFDTDDFIGAPDGRVHAPRIKRPVLPLFDTLRSYSEEIAPDLSTTSDYVAPDMVDASALIREAAAAAIDAIVAEGKRSRTDSKKDTWLLFGDDEIDMVVQIANDIVSGDLNPEGIEGRIDSALSAA